MNLSPGFDEYINLTIDRCEEVYTKDNKRRAVGRVLLKGENVSLFVSLGQDDDK
jgi:small nuclear ribonucleoprotein E